MKKPLSSTFPPIDFDLRQLEIFLKVVDLQSFSRAAQAVSLAQASVSERIATLENMVGTRLLDRMGRRISPTKAGELLYKHAVLLLDMKRTACLELESFLGVKQGEIHIGGSTIPGEYILPKLIGRFKDAYPLIFVKQTIADTNRIVTRVLEGDFELGVIGSRSEHKSLTHHELWKDELILAVAEGHRWVKKKRVSLKELFEEPFILREIGSGTLKIMEDYFERSGFKGLEGLQVVARMGSSTAIKEGIKAGLGVSILSSRAMDTELKTGTLKALKFKGLRMFRTFYLIRDRRKFTSPICQAMIDFLLSSADRG